MEKKSRLITAGIVHKLVEILRTIWRILQCKAMQCQQVTIVAMDIVIYVGSILTAGPGDRWKYCVWAAKENAHYTTTQTVRTQTISTLLVSQYSELHDDSWKLFRLIVLNLFNISQLNETCGRLVAIWIQLNGMHKSSERDPCPSAIGLNLVAAWTSASNWNPVRVGAQSELLELLLNIQLRFDLNLPIYLNRWWDLSASRVVRTGPIIDSSKLVDCINSCTW
jgi:hypothetical protein